MAPDPLPPLLFPLHFVLPQLIFCRLARKPCFEEPEGNIAKLGKGQHSKALTKPINLCMRVKQCISVTLIMRARAPHSASHARVTQTERGGERERERASDSESRSESTSASAPRVTARTRERERERASERARGRESERASERARTREKECERERERERERE